MAKGVPFIGENLGVEEVEDLETPSHKSDRQFPNPVFDQRIEIKKDVIVYSA